MAAKTSKDTEVKGKASTQEVGKVGTQIFGGQITGEEYNSDLANLSNAVSYYDKMERTDSQVSRALKLITYPVLGAEWSIEPYSQEDKDLEIAEFVELNLFANDNFSWTDKLREILKYLQFGFALFEKVYEYRDGKYFLKDLSPRLQKTIKRWHQNEDGTLKEVEQWVYTDKGKSGQFRIPNEYLVLFVNEQQGNNWQGISVLRSIYRHWLSKDMLIRIDGIRHERQGLGVPKVTLPAGATSADKTAAADVCETFRAHDKGYLILPEGWQFEVMDMKAGSLTDIKASLEWHDSAISSAILADFMELGKTASGNRALGETLGNMFYNSLLAVVQYIEDVFNGSVGKRKMIRELVDLNFSGFEGYPKLSCPKLGYEDWEKVGTVISALMTAGVLTKGPEDENFVRRGLRMPEMEETEEPEEEPEPDIEEPEVEEPEPEVDEPDTEKPEEEPTKATCSCGQVHLGERTFWRPLTDVETNIDLNEIASRLQGYTEDMVKIGDRWRLEMIKALAAKGLNLLKSKASIEEFTRGIGRVKVPYAGRMAGELAKKLKEVYGYSKGKVRSELSAQGLKMRSPLDPLVSDEDESKKMALPLSELSVLFLQTKLLNEFRKELTRQRIAGAVDSVALVEALKKLSKADFAREVKGRAMEVFGAARGAEVEKHKGEIKKVIRSEVMDENTCDACKEIDGLEMDIDSAEYSEMSSGPYRNCEGGELCRGVNIFLKEP